MNPIKTSCFGCKYNYNWRCVKDSICTGSVPDMSNKSELAANTCVMPDELEINDVKYRRVEDDKTRTD